MLLLTSCQSSSTKPKKVESRVSVLPYYNAKEFTPIWSSPDSLPAGFHRIKEFELVNQEGQLISTESLKGKIYVADFFFTTCPGICPKMTDNMNIVQEAFKEDEDVIILSHSVTPKIDSVPMLKNYAQNHGVISGKWHLLTGNRNEIYELGRSFYFIEEDLGEERDDYSEEFIHTENFVLVDADRHLRGIYNGLNKTSVNQLIADIRTLLNDSSSR
jgi:protein SCO1/2